MANSSEKVFGSWNVGEVIGSGTDGRVSYIHKTNGEGREITSVLKTIFFHSDRSESKGFNKIGDILPKKEENMEEIVTDVADNIDIIMQSDGGKRFVKYEEYEVKPVKDGFVLYIRLEQMRSLENLLEEFSLTREESIQIGISVCRGLIRSRKFSYIYPNLKPENILFDERGKCKLGDFGSFSYLEPSKASLAYKKSSYYMAPEFLKSGKSNTTCDTYALGMVLYMLTNRGRLPFVEEYPAPITPAGLDNALKRRTKGELFPKPLIADDSLFSIIKKACDPDPKNRYFHPGQMLEDLKSIAEGKDVGAPKYEEIYSNTQPAPQGDVPAASAQDNNINDFLVQNGMPDPRNVKPVPPSSLSFDAILYETKRAAAQEQARPAAEAPEQAVLPSEPARTRPQAPAPSKPENELMVADEEVEDFEPEKKKSLLEQIRIPNVRPIEYVKGKAARKDQGERKPGRFFLRDLPQSKDDKAYNLTLKRAVIVAAALVLVIILIITSCSIRNKNKPDSDAAALSQSSQSQVDSAAADETSDESTSESQINNNADAGTTSQISNG